MMLTTKDTSLPVTVLLSIHNGEETLDRCLESIISQTFSDIHILCIDDASTDKTSEILTKWKERIGEKLVMIRNEKNIGLTLSLNKGIDVITTSLIARIDADDWWEATKIEKQVNFLLANPDYGVIGTNYINHASHQERKVVLPETNVDIQKSIFWRNPFAHSAVVYRKDVILLAGKYDPLVRYAQDYELWVRCSKITAFYNLQEFLCYRTLGTGISVDKQNDQMKQYLKVLRKYLPLYNRPLLDYMAMIEPIIVLSLPEWLKKLKRHYLP